MGNRRNLFRFAFPRHFALCAGGRAGRERGEGNAARRGTAPAGCPPTS
ncbi:hypothetical protein [Candidatus Bacteroides intestinigallinarum]|nr:hypothetical protein [Candidatus Bacteroides intestinigallinarum]MCS3200128.1 hypothetical protein [Candidatus Bacteroides intestinigallinarum]